MERGKLKEVEECIQKVVCDLRSGRCKTIAVAASKHEAPYHTIQNYYLRKTTDWFTTQEGGQMLTEAQEKVLVQWISYLGVFEE